MECFTKINDDLYYVGYSSRRIDLFENIYPVPEGVSYNSYLYLDEKTALIDAVDRSVSEVFFDNVETLLAGKNLDYLIVNHVEPDHSGTIKTLLEKYPKAVVVCTVGAKKMLEQFVGEDLSSRVQEIDKLEGLNLGKHKLEFIKAPMVHWPEVMMTLDTSTGTLFSADAFGSFGAISGSIYADSVTFDEKIKETYRRYYINIVGKFGSFVQNAMRALSGKDIKTICPLHGRVWRKNLNDLLELYDKWSRFEPEQEGVLIVYASVYGGTELACNVLANELYSQGITNTSMYDVSKTDSSYLLAELAKYGNLVIASTTYNLGLFIKMEDFLRDVANHNFANRTVAVLENGSWAPSAKKVILEILSKCVNFSILENDIVIKSRLTKQQLPALEIVAKQIKENLKSAKN